MTNDASSPAQSPVRKMSARRLRAPAKPRAKDVKGDSTGQQLAFPTRVPTHRPPPTTRPPTETSYYIHRLLTTSCHPCPQPPRLKGLRSPIRSNSSRASSRVGSNASSMRSSRNNSGVSTPADEGAPGSRERAYLCVCIRVCACTRGLWPACVLQYGAATFSSDYQLGLFIAFVRLCMFPCPIPFRSRRTADRLTAWAGGRCAAAALHAI